MNTKCKKKRMYQFTTATITFLHHIETILKNIPDIHSCYFKSNHPMLHFSLITPKISVRRRCTPDPIGILAKQQEKSLLKDINLTCWDFVSRNTLNIDFHAIQYNCYPILFLSNIQNIQLHDICTNTHQQYPTMDPIKKGSTTPYIEVN